MYSDWLGCTRESGAAFVLATVVVAMVCVSGVGEKVSWFIVVEELVLIAL
jgi:uncharacterized protein YqhQ